MNEFDFFPYEIFNLNYYLTLEDLTKLKEVLRCLKMGGEIQSSEGGCSLLAAFCGKLVR